MPERHAVCPTAGYVDPIAMPPAPDDPTIGDALHWARDLRAEAEKKNRDLADLRQELIDMGCEL